MSAATAAESGLIDGDKITVTAEGGSLSLPVRIADLPDRVVWLPSNSGGHSVTRDLRATAGDVVKIGSAHRNGADAMSTVSPGRASGTTAGEAVPAERVSGTTVAREANEKR